MGLFVGAHFTIALNQIGDLQLLLALLPGAGFGAVVRRIGGGTVSLFAPGGAGIRLLLLRRGHGCLVGTGDIGGNVGREGPSRREGRRRDERWHAVADLHVLPPTPLQAASTAGVELLTHACR